MIKLINGDSKEVLKEFPDNYFDSVVTDPPYGLTSIVKRFKDTSIAGDTQTEQDAKERKTPYSRTSRGFMGKEWDGSGIEYDIEFWKEVYRVLKPGGHVLAMSGTRTYHKVATAIEEAGFEIRDMIQWLYGQGFPKSLDISKQIDKLQGKERAISGLDKKFGRADSGIYNYNNGSKEDRYVFERKDIPVSEEAQQWDGWGTALKPANEPIVLARKPISEKSVALNVLKWGTGGINIDDSRIELNGEIIPINVLESWSGFGEEDRPAYTPTTNIKGRFPANVILDEEAGKILDEQREGASRFFYASKASPKERKEYNTHATVKPIALMEYLIKLITPANGIVLEPFMGSGTTILACKRLGYSVVGIELEKDSFDISVKRLEELE